MPPWRTPRTRPRQQTHRSRLTKCRDHGDMIRRLWQLTQLAFQGDGGTTRCQRRRHQDVVDTEAEVALERQGPVIPPAIQPPFLAMQTEGIAQPPREQSCESGTLVRVKQNA